MPESAIACSNAATVVRGEIGERGVEERRVLALEEPDAAEIGRAGDGAARDLLARRSPPPRARGRDRAARRSRRSRPSGCPCRGSAAPRRERAARSSGMKSAAVIFMPAFDHRDRRPRRPRRGPAGQSQNGGRLALAGRPMRIAPTRLERAPLHDRVDEMRRADHDGIDGLVADGAGCREAARARRGCRRSRRASSAP